MCCISWYLILVNISDKGKCQCYFQFCEIQNIIFRSHPIYIFIYIYRFWFQISFFQAAVASILLYGCTTWTLTKRLEKKLDGNYTRMLRAILNKSCRQHPTRHQLYNHLPPITKTIQVRRARHAGHCWRSRDELISDVLLWIPTHSRQKQDDQHEHTFSNYVRIRDVVRKTCLRRWTIGKSGERGSGISVLPARHDDDDIWESYASNSSLSS